MTDWLWTVSVVSLLLGVACTVGIGFDVARRPQPMWIMNLVWPITALYAGPLAVWLYVRYGRKASALHMSENEMRGHELTAIRKPAWVSYAEATTHCGSGCTLADIVCEWAIYFFPAMLAWFGYPALFGKPMFAAWVLDFIAAFALGVAFQYFTIAPMRNLSVGQGIVAALKADALSLTAWQLGMYGWMAIATFAIFGREIAKTSPVFWFMMQIAMLCGFATSYPVNIWLVSRGIKEKM